MKQVVPPYQSAPKLNTSLLSLFLILLSTDSFSQRPTNTRSLFAHVEYQFRQYDYLTVGLGYQPKKTLSTWTRKNKYSFTGWTANYCKKLDNEDWGVSIQTLAYSANGVGLEGNYKAIHHSPHYSFKPLIGLSFPFVSIMYGYNFDFYKIKEERIRPSELILGLRLAIIRWKA